MSEAQGGDTAASGSFEDDYSTAVAAAKKEQERLNAEEVRIVDRCIILLTSVPHGVAELSEAAPCCKFSRCWQGHNAFLPLSYRALS